MRILLVTAGSRGDVEPFLAFARHATAAGHSARVVIPDNSGADASDLDAVSLGVDYSALIEQQGVSARAALRSLRTVVRPIMRSVILNSVRIALEWRPDVIVYHPKILSAPLAADYLGIPHVVVEIVPVLSPTSQFAAAGTTTANLGPLNRLTYRAAAASAVMFRDELAEARALLGCPARSRTSPPTASLIPISPALLPRPHDWNDNVHLTGAWVDRTAVTRLDPALAAFLDGGDFVYAGFGSMASGDPVERGRMIVDAARQHGTRLLVATGLGGVTIPKSLISDDILVTTTVDHSSVLPQATAAIHHGGIGTVHAAARAGTTSVIVPFIADQPFWGAQLHRAGISPAPIPARSLSVTRLSAALAQVGDYADRTRDVATAMSTENGLGTALAVVEEQVAG
jgi:sterol 3beta-glucosyltransferase